MTTFKPSIAPRWNSTTIFFLLFGAAVAATARCRNDGSEAIPIIAMPPLFRKYRREILIAVLRYSKTQQAGARRAVLPSLEFRRTEDQACDQALVHLLDRPQHLLVVDPLLESLPRASGHLAAQKNIKRSRKRYSRVLRSLLAQHRAQIQLRTGHVIAGEGEGEVETVQ